MNGSMELGPEWGWERAGIGGENFKGAFCFALGQFQIVLANSVRNGIELRTMPESAGIKVDQQWGESLNIFLMLVLALGLGLGRKC